MPFHEAFSGTGKLCFLVCALFVAAGFLRLNDLSLDGAGTAEVLVRDPSLVLETGAADGPGAATAGEVVVAPLYPLLVAPAGWLFPMRVEPVKIVTLGWGALAVFLFYLWLTELAGRPVALAGAAMLAFNPLFFVYSTEALPVAPLMALILMVLILLAKIEGGKTPGRAAWWGVGVACGSLTLLGGAGIAFWFVVCAYLFAREWKRGLLVLFAGVIALGGWIMLSGTAAALSSGGSAGGFFAHLLTDPEGPFTAELAARAARNLPSFFPGAAGWSFFSLPGREAVMLLGGGAGAPAAVRIPVSVLAGLAIAAGMYRAVKSAAGGRMLVTAWFALILGAALAPEADARVLCILLPFSIFFALNGIAAVGTRGDGKSSAMKFAATAAALAVLVPGTFQGAGLISLNRTYLGLSRAPGGNPSGADAFPEYYARPWGLLRQGIDAMVRPGDVIAAPGKEAALAAGGRKILVVAPGTTQSEFDRRLREGGAAYILSMVEWGDFGTYEFLMNESRRFGFKEVLSAGNLHLMKISPRNFMEAGVSGVAGSQGAGREEGAAGLLRQARASIRRGEYSSALALLDSAAGVAPGRPEIPFQGVIAAAMAGDSARALEEFDRLEGIQGAEPIFPSARYHLFLSGLVKSVSLLPPEPDRVYKVYDLSRRYWDHGYYAQARDLLTAAMSEDTSFFVGHLWAFHYNFQTGDTAAARLFLDRLDAIDDSNSLVRNFHALMTLRRSVSTMPKGAGRASLRLRMARIYREIELPDEAVDEATAALSDDPAMGEARLFLEGDTVRPSPGAVVR